MLLLSNAFLFFHITQYFSFSEQLDSSRFRSVSSICLSGGSGREIAQNTPPYLCLAPAGGGGRWERHA